MLSFECKYIKTLFAVGQKINKLNVSGVQYKHGAADGGARRKAAV